MKSKVARRILAETPEETKIFVRKYAEIVACVHDIMAQKGLTQRDLAARMDKNPSELSRWLHGEHNMTLRSLAKLEAELGEDIIVVRRINNEATSLPKQKIAPRTYAAIWTSGTTWKILQFVASTPTLAEESIA